jgi:hypothetical protein
VRAAREHQPYWYGYGEPSADDGFRVLNARGVAVIDAGGPWLLVSVRRVATTIAPVDVRVSVNREVVLKVQLTDDAPFTGVVDLGAATGPLLFETSALDAGQWSAWPWNAASHAQMKWTFADDVAPRFKVSRRSGGGGQD